MAFFSFSFLVASSLTLGQLYLYWRLFRKLIKGKTGRTAVISVMAILSGSVLLRRPLRALLSAEGSDLYSQGTYAMMAIALALILGTAASDLLRAVFFMSDLFRGRKAKGLRGLRVLGGSQGSVGFEDTLLEKEEAAVFSGSTSASNSDALASDSCSSLSSSDALTSDAPNSDAPNSDAPTSDAPNSDAPNSDAPNSDAPNSDAKNLSDPGRRAFILRTLPSLALAGGAITAGYGSWRAFDGHRIKEVAVHLPKLPKTLDGFSIAHLSDLHVGPFIDRRYVEKLVAQANALKPDLVAITGDLVDGSVEHLGPAVAALQNLCSRHGTYFVTGNHDYYSGDVEWSAFLESIGIHVLRNRHVSIGDSSGSFDLVGVDDWSGGRRRGLKGYDLDLALTGRDLDAAAVLLAHQPANFPEAAAHGIGLQLSGHTHGGQIFPGTLLVGLQWEYVAGLYQHEDSHIFVSRGSGFWGPPLRVGSPPEIVKIVLTA